MNHTVTLVRGFDKSFRQPFGAPRRGVEWAIEIAGAHAGMVVVRTYFTSQTPDDAERKQLAEKAIRFVERKMAGGYLPWPGVLEYEEDVVYATLQRLRSDRDSALRSDVPKAATILGYVREETQTAQKSGPSSDRMCSVVRSIFIADIIAYLRTKTGEDLGDNPEPWIQKYATKD